MIVPWLPLIFSLFRGVICHVTRSDALGLTCPPVSARRPSGQYESVARMFVCVSFNAPKYHNLFSRIGPPIATLFSQLKSSWLGFLMNTASSGVRLLELSALFEPNARHVPDILLPPSFGITSLRIPPTASSA